MSAGARMLSRDPAFKRGQRKRPRKQLIASILINIHNEDDAGYHLEWRKIHRTRIMQRRRCVQREGKPPGEDGYRWTCTCDPKFFMDFRRWSTCNHMTELIEGKLTEERPPPGDEAYKFTCNVYVELTTLGARVLRPQWAQNTLRGMLP
jgi:hypothetical protein